MNLQTFTSFNGRIGRQTWWLGIIVLTVLQWILMMVLGGFGAATIDPNNPDAAAAMSSALVPLGIVFLLFLWPALAIYTKRWHDRGKSGWWSLIILIPIIGGIWLLVEQGFLRGTDGPNNYGDDPIAG